MNKLTMFQMDYPTGSIPRFTTYNQNYRENLASIWDIVYSNDTWIDKPFYVDGELFKTRADYRDFYRLS